MEIAGGSLLVVSGAVAALMIGLAAGPGLFPCGVLGDDEDPDDRACERRAEHEQREAWITGSIVGSLVGVVGIGLIVHGVRRLDAARHPTRVTVLPAQLSRSGFGLLAIHSF